MSHYKYNAWGKCRALNLRAAGTYSYHRVLTGLASIYHSDTYPCIRRCLCLLITGQRFVGLSGSFRVPTFSWFRACTNGGWSRFTSWALIKSIQPFLLRTKDQAVHTSTMSTTTYQAIRYYNWKDHYLNLYSCENLKICLYLRKYWFATSILKMKAACFSKKRW
jgi:hypothetical protein